MIVKLEDAGDGTGDLILPIPDEILEKMNLSDGDQMELDFHDGYILISKAPETELILVVTISTFEISYLVQIPSGCSSLSALTMIDENKDTAEVAQKWLGEDVKSIEHMESFEHAAARVQMIEPYLTPEIIRNCINVIK